MTIADIRKCMRNFTVPFSVNPSLTVLLSIGRVRELEEKRINKEMANIRSKFKGKFLAKRTHIKLVNN
jgi:hypothetical protein